MTEQNNSRGTVPREWEEEIKLWTSAEEKMYEQE